MTISSHRQTAARAALGIGIAVALAVLPAVPADAATGPPDHAAADGERRGPPDHAAADGERRGPPDHAATDGGRRAASEVTQRQEEAPPREVRGQNEDPHGRDRGPKADRGVGPASADPPRRGETDQTPPGLNRSAEARGRAHGEARPPGPPPHARGHDDVEAPEEPAEEPVEAPEEAVEAPGEPDADAPRRPDAVPAPSTERSEPVTSERAEPLLPFARAPAPAGPPSRVHPNEPAPGTPEPPPTAAWPPRSAMDHALGLLPEPADALPPLRDPAVPMLLIVVLAAYALVVARGDRRDPKLARSSVDRSRGLGFE